MQRDYGDECQCERCLLGIVHEERNHPMTLGEKMTLSAVLCFIFAVIGLIFIN